MNGFLNIIKTVGQYIYRNSVWLIPVTETAIRQIKKIIRRKKDERKFENEGEIGGGEIGQDRGFCPDSLQDKQ